MSLETDATTAPHDRDVADGSGTSTSGMIAGVAIELMALVGTVLWTGFWGNIARLHLVAESSVGNDPLNAAFTLAVTVLPVLVLYGRHLASQVDHPAFDVPDISSIPHPTDA